jgi:hypothetical protein
VSVVAWRLRTSVLATIAIVTSLPVTKADADRPKTPFQMDSPASCGPLKALSGGWTCIPGFGRDAWIGSYYDGDSGALVRFQSGGGRGGDLVQRLASKELADPADRVSSGALEGVRYRRLTFQNPREREVRDLRRFAGEDYPVKDSLDEWRLPPVGSYGCGVTFYREGRAPLSFLAYVCTRHQEDRVFDLLLGRLRIGFELIGEPVESAGVSENWVAGLPVGMSLRDVIARAGTPRGTYADGCERLMLVYSVQGSAKQARLVFDRKQALVSRRFWKQED